MRRQVDDGDDLRAEALEEIVHSAHGRRMAVARDSITRAIKGRLELPDGVLAGVPLKEDARKPSRVKVLGGVQV